MYNYKYNTHVHIRDVAECFYSKYSTTIAKLWRSSVMCYKRISEQGKFFAYCFPTSVIFLIISNLIQQSVIFQFFMWWFMELQVYFTCHCSKDATYLSDTVQLYLTLYTFCMVFSRYQIPRHAVEFKSMNTDDRAYLLIKWGRRHLTATITLTKR